MKVFSFIKRKLNISFRTKTLKNFKSEDEFYTYLFTKHPKWNKPKPNKAELKRFQIIDNFIKNLELNSQINIIDFGCGRGWLTNELSKFGFVTGIEPVKKVVEYAKKIFPNQNFIVGSIEQLSTKKVDIIVCSEVIEHIKDEFKNKYFNAFFNALNPYSYLIITTPRAEVQDIWLSYRDNSGQPVEDWLTESKLEDLAKKNGFETIEKKIIEENANGDNTPILDLYQVWFFKKHGN